MNPLKIVFMGSAELSCNTLSRLAREPEFEISAIVTQPDRPKGRHLKPQASPVKVLAERLGKPILQPERARSESFLQDLKRFAPDLVVVVAYGQILPQTLLDLPRLGCINVHTSLLPKYRGAGPIQWAILNGESETGVTIMKMDAGLDTGDILTQEHTQIEESDTAETLYNRLAEMGAELAARTIPAYARGEIAPRPQPTEGVSYAPKIRKQDGEIDWSCPARVIRNKVRGLTPWPGAFTWLRQGEDSALRLKVLKVEEVDETGPPGEVLVSQKNTLVVACGAGALAVRLLQLEGGKPLEPQQFLAGHLLRPGYRFSGASARESSQ